MADLKNEIAKTKAQVISQPFLPAHTEIDNKPMWEQKEKKSKPYSRFENNKHYTLARARKDKANAIIISIIFGIIFLFVAFLPISIAVAGVFDIKEGDKAMTIGVFISMIIGLLIVLFSYIVNKNHIEKRLIRDY